MKEEKLDLRLKFARGSYQFSRMANSNFDHASPSSTQKHLPASHLHDLDVLQRLHQLGPQHGLGVAMAQLVIVAFAPGVELPVRRHASREIEARRQVHEPPGVVLLLHLLVFAAFLPQLPWRELDVGARDAAFLNGEMA